MPDDEGLLDIGEAATFLNVSEVSLRRWTNAGHLACVRVGRRRERRFRRADLIAFLEHQPARTPARPAGASRGEAQPTVGDTTLPLGTHLCGLYASERGRAAQAAAFLADGLAGGSVSFLAATTDAQGEVLTELRRREPAVEAHIAAGRLVVSQYANSADAQTAYWDGHFRTALDGGAKALCVVGDVSGAGLAGQSFAAAIDYEWSYDRLLARRFPVVTLCQYDVRRCSGGDLLEVLKCHEDAFRYPQAHMLA